MTQIKIEKLTWNWLKFGINMTSCHKKTQFPICPIVLLPTLLIPKTVAPRNLLSEKKDPAGDYWQRRHVVCDDGWYHRLNDENSFEAVVGRSNGKRATAQYIQGAGGDAMPQYLYVCEKYVGCEPKNSLILKKAALHITS